MGLVLTVLLQSTTRLEQKINGLLENQSSRRVVHDRIREVGGTFNEFSSFRMSSPFTNGFCCPESADLPVVLKTLVLVMFELFFFSYLNEQIL